MDRSSNERGNGNGEQRRRQTARKSTTRINGFELGDTQSNRRESNSNNEDQDPRLRRTPSIARANHSYGPQSLEAIRAYQRDFLNSRRTGEHIGLSDRRNPNVPRQTARKVVTSYDQPQAWRKDPADNIESPQGDGRSNRGDNGDRTQTGSSGSSSRSKQSGSKSQKK